MRQATAMQSDHLDVLIVDSRPEDYVRLAASVAGDRFVFQFAATGQDALRLRSTSANSLWLVNAELSDMSGFELQELLQTRRGTTVCVVSDAYRLEDELRSRCCGAAMYACKPPLAHWLAPWSRLESAPWPAPSEVPCDVPISRPMGGLTHNVHELM
jgi:CheY-like chemotaxis protein